MCACTFHFFYNNPSLYWDVNLQAVLTTVGNTLVFYRNFVNYSNNCSEFNIVYVSSKFVYC